MKRQNARNQLVRDFARLGISDSLPKKARSEIVKAAINERVTINEMLWETVSLEAGLFSLAPHAALDEP